MVPGVDYARRRDVLFALVLRIISRAQVTIKQYLDGVLERGVVE